MKQPAVRKSKRTVPKGINPRTISNELRAAAALAVLCNGGRGGATVTISADDAHMIARFLWKAPKRDKDPGKPKGRGHIASDATVISELERRAAAGERPTTAARQLLQSRGLPHEKGRVDHLVRLLRKSAK